MSSALFIPVKETLVELRKQLKKATPMLQPRIKMLILMKEAGEEGISKRSLMEQIGACSQSIHGWRTTYKQGGIGALLFNGKLGMVGKPSVFSKQEHARLEKKLRDPKNGLAGYVELQQWVKEELNKDVKYNTLLKYAARHFGASVKAARKSHVDKDEQAVETFKKNSRKP